VYDITSRRSFENLTFWMSNIKEHGSENAILCVLGNKCDSDGRQITMEEGLTFAAEHNCNFFETSALTDTNIDQAFQYITEAVLQKNSKLQTVRKDSHIVLGGGEKKGSCCNS